MYIRKEAVLSSQIEGTQSTLTELLQYENSEVVVSIRRLAQSLEITVPTATTAVTRLEQLGIVREITGKSYGRVFVYDQQLEILNRSGE